MKKNVSKLALIGLSIISGASALAQPSDAQIASLIKGKGAIDVKFTSAQGTVHTTLTEKYYLRTAESKWSTEVAGIYRWERSDYRYDYRGGSWAFNRSYFGSGWYDGIPNPSEKEILALLESSQVGYQGAYFQKPVFSLAADPKFNWHTFNSVEFNVEAIYYKKVSYTEFNKVKATFPVRLYKDTGGGRYDNSVKKAFKDAAWLPIQMDVISVDYGKEEVLESKKISNAESENLRNMQETYADEKNKARISSMGSLDVPAFQNDKEAIYWVHHFLYAGDASKAELLLYSLLTPFYFEGSSLNERGKQLLENLKSGMPSYSKIYCEYPSIKHQQSGMIQFYDRENYSYARISVQQENGQYKIADLDFAFAPNANQLASCQAAGDANCSKPVNTATPKAPEKFQIGDAVVVNWNGQNQNYFKGTIKKIDEYNSNRYFIEFEEVQSAWVDAKFISKR